MVSFKPLPTDSLQSTEVLGLLFLEITHVLTETLGSSSA